MICPFARLMPGRSETLVLAHLALFQDTKIKTRMVMRDQHRRHPGLIHSEANATPARNVDAN